MQKAPSFFLTALGAARVIGGPPGPSTSLMLIFHGNKGADTAHNLNTVMRSLYPRIEQLQIASIVELQRVPRFMRSAVEQTLTAAYRQSAKSVPKELDPREYVLIAPDWEGKVTKEFGMSDRVNDIGIVLITPPWQICQSYTGNDLQSAAVRMLADCKSTLNAAVEPDSQA